MGWVTDKIGVAASTYITLGVTAASLLGFSFLQAEVPLMACAFVFGMNSVIITISVPTLISELFGKKYFAQILSYSRMSGIIGCFGAAAVGACFDLTGSYIGSFFAGIAIMADVYKRQHHGRAHDRVLPFRAPPDSLPARAEPRPHRGD